MKSSIKMTIVLYPVLMCMHGPNNLDAQACQKDHNDA